MKSAQRTPSLESSWAVNPIGQPWVRPPPYSNNYKSPSNPKSSAPTAPPSISTNTQSLRSPVACKSLSQAASGAAHLRMTASLTHSGSGSSDSNPKPSAGKTPCFPLCKCGKHSVMTLAIGVAGAKNAALSAAAILALNDKPLANASKLFARLKPKPYWRTTPPSRSSSRRNHWYVGGQLGHAHPLRSPAELPLPRLRTQWSCAANEFADLEINQPTMMPLPCARLPKQSTSSHLNSKISLQKSSKHSAPLSRFFRAGPPYTPASTDSAKRIFSKPRASPVRLLNMQTPPAASKLRSTPSASPVSLKLPPSATTAKDKSNSMPPQTITRTSGNNSAPHLESL